jgi:hypothetical protein
MALTVGLLREILKNEAIDDGLVVALVVSDGTRFVALSASGTSIIERDKTSLSPATGRLTETKPERLTGERETIFALYDR